MNFLRRFLYGRNGPDQLGLAVVFFGLAVSIAARFIPFDLVRNLLLSADYLCLAYFFFRVLSRNVYRRQQENQRFLSLLRGFQGRMRESKSYRYLKCPRCALRLRAPRGRGRIRVTCQRCGESFEKTV